MKRCCACTASFGLAAESATPYFSSLPSTPFLVLGEICLISGWPALMCSIGELVALELVLALHRVGAGARHG